MNTDSKAMQDMAITAGFSLLLGIVAGALVMRQIMLSRAIPETVLMTLRSLLWALQGKIRTAMTATSIRVVNDSLGEALNLIEQAGLMTGGTLNDGGDR